MARPFALLASIVLAASACSGGEPTASAEPASHLPSAPESQPASVPAGQEPPPCLEATLFFDPALETMLLANCVDQLAGQSAEQIWSWDGQSWQLVDGEGRRREDDLELRLAHR